jgi:peptidoglycan hydrolase-like protein with peptidoglycan-binding domain
MDVYNRRQERRGREMSRVWRAGLAAIAVSLSTLSASAVASDRPALNAVDAAGVDAAGAPVPTPASSLGQIRRAQAELKRLDCLKGRVNGRLDDRTREAVKKFWAMAKQPAVDVKITDELISNLTERGDNFCRPPRRFFSFGGRSLPPLFAPGARPAVVPPMATQPPSSKADH